MSISPISPISPILPDDDQYQLLPWKAGGSDRAGIDCRGLALLWLREQMAFTAAPVDSPAEDDDAAARAIAEALQRAGSRPADGPHERGEAVFFRVRKTGKIHHVAMALGGNRYLHITRGGTSRIENGLTLLRRIGCEPVGALSVEQAELLARALNDRHLGDPVSPWILIAVSIALSAASAFLMPKPKLGQFRNETGRYGFDNLVTRTDPQQPLPDLLGAVTVAGNAPYQSLLDKTQAITDATQQRANKLIILASGPIEAVTYDSAVLKINARPYTDTYWHPSGMALNPAQTKAEAVDGTIGGESGRGSMTVYDGAPAISVPVDVRAQYDRNMPLYGFAGCGYVALRLIDGTKHQQVNITVPVKGRLCRTFTASGFTTSSVSAESLSGADGSKVRFKLANSDISSVSSVTVNGTAYSAVSASNQSGNVYHLNAAKGYLEFITAPAAAATILVDYVYWPRAWTQNPVSHLVYLLTEPTRGKGLPAAKIDWSRAVTARDYCDATLLWQRAEGSVVEARHTSNYALDYRKPIQDHLRAVLDTLYGYLFLSGGKFVIKPRRDESSAFSFTTTTILRDSFSAEQLDRSGLANQVKVFYHPRETFNTEAGVVREDKEDQLARADWVGNEGIVDQTLKLLGVDRESHAERLAETILRENVGAQWVAELKTTVKGLALEPGDVVDVTHPAMPGWTAKLMRIEDLSHDADGRLTLKLSEYFASAYI